MDVGNLVGLAMYAPKELAKFLVIQGSQTVVDDASTSAPIDSIVEVVEKLVLLVRYVPLPNVFSPARQVSPIASVVVSIPKPIGCIVEPVERNANPERFAPKEPVLFLVL